MEEDGALLLSSSNRLDERDFAAETDGTPEDRDLLIGSGLISEEDEDTIRIRRNDRNFEDVFYLIGNMGWIQFGYYVFGCIIEIAVSLSVMFYIFEYAHPEWTCEVSHITDDNGTSYMNTTVVTNFCPAEDLTCDNLTFSAEFTSVSTEWGFICDRQYLGRLTASLYFIGVMIGACACGQLSDTLGRKRTLLGMWCFLIVCQFSTGFAPVWEVYLPMRILAGVFAGGCATVAMVLPMEFLGPKYRMLTSNRIGWQLGGCLIALVGYLTRRWDYMAMAAGLITLPFVPLYAIFMPESARWLIMKGRTEEAREWLDKIAKYNRRECPSIAMIEEVAKTEKAQQSIARKYSYLDLFRTRKFAIRTCILMLGWFDVSLLSYGLSSDMEKLSGSIYLNATIASVAMMALRWTAIPIANRIGRRKTYLLYKVLLLLCVVVEMILVLLDGEKYGLVITGIVLFSFVWQAGVWSMVFIYSSEAYPTLIRTRACAVGNISGRVAGILGPQVGLLRVIHPSAPYVLYLAMGLATGILFYLVMPETNNKPLPDEMPPRNHKYESRAAAAAAENKGADDLEMM